MADRGSGAVCRDRTGQVRKMAQSGYATCVSRGLIFFHVECMAAVEPKADTPLIVDPDRILASPISFQELQPVGWRHPQVIDPGCRIDHIVVCRQA
jgi:hypothetical protein